MTQKTSSEFYTLQKGIFLSNSVNIFNRFSASMLFNIVRGVLTLLTTLLLARFLGVEDYGRMAFLLASFLAFKSLLDVQSSHAFFTFLSQKLRSKKFVNMFWYWMAFQLFFSLCLIGFILPDEVIKKVWINESRFLVVLALIATFMHQSAWQVGSQMAEAQRKTINVQKLGTIIVSSNLFLILLLQYFDVLTLPILFFIVTLEWAIGAFLAARMYVGAVDTSDTFSTAVAEFWVYCKPLVPYVWLVALGEFLDRWMLQAWGGNTEQAYYAVALNIMAIASIAAVSIIRIFWKEIAELYHQGNMELMESLYQRTSRMIYFFASFFVGACLPWSSEILTMALGYEYLGATMTFMLLLLYSTHQSLGQVYGVVLFATGKVKLQTVMGSVFVIVSLVAAYYALAPSNASIPGLDLGSEGLAWKMLIMNFVYVNVLGYVVAGQFNWKYHWCFQFSILGVAILLGYLVKSCIAGLFSATYLSIAASFLVYLVIVGFLCYFFPTQAWGITKQELDRLLSKSVFKKSSPSTH